MKRLLFAAIAVSVMVGCTEDLQQVVEQTGSDIPVNIEYKAPSKSVSRSASRSTAVAKVTEKSGVVKSCSLSMGDGILTGVIEDVECEELVQVSIELFDENGVLTYKGKDVVEKVNDSLYEVVNSDLYAVDENGNVLLDEAVIQDINGSKEKLSEAAIAQFLTLFMKTIDLNEDTQGQITEAVLDREWSESELLLIEEFIFEIHNVIKQNDSILIWDTDTVEVMETGKLFDFNTLVDLADSTAEFFEFDKPLFQAHLKSKTDYFNLPWYEGQVDKVKAYLELEAKKFNGGHLYYESYDEVKAVCYEMSEAANVDYIDVMDELGDEFWNGYWNENDSKAVQEKISQAITKVPEKVVVKEVVDSGFYNTIDEVKLYCKDKSEEAGIDPIKVIDELGEMFWKLYWSAHPIYKVNEQIQSAIGSVEYFEKYGNGTVDVSYFVSVEELEEFTYEMSRGYGANYDGVISLLGEDFFTTFWQENDRSVVSEKLKNAIDQVLFFDSMDPEAKYHYAENVVSTANVMANDANIEFSVVKEKLGDTFFDSFWKDNSKTVVNQKIKEVVEGLVIELEDYFTQYGDVKDLCFTLSEEAGVNYMDVMDQLGDEFWDSYWREHTRTEVETKIAEVVKQVALKA